MATIIPGSIKRWQRSSYRFNEWFDGQQRRLLEGEDFTAKVESVKIYIWRKARKLGIKVSVCETVYEGKAALLVQSFPS